MVNRLRPILSELISVNQSAFVPGRLITDNALVAFGCLHFIEHNKKLDSNFCAYKLDLSKAHDKVDWDFLRKVIQRMGFAHQWVDWIMSCVTTVRDSVNSMEPSWIRFPFSRSLTRWSPVPLSLSLCGWWSIGFVAKGSTGTTYNAPSSVSACTRSIPSALRGW